MCMRGVSEKRIDRRTHRAGKPDAALRCHHVTLSASKRCRQRRKTGSHLVGLLSSSSAVGRIASTPAAQRTFQPGQHGPSRRSRSFLLEKWTLLLNNCVWALRVSLRRWSGAVFSLVYEEVKFEEEQLLLTPTGASPPRSCVRQLERP